MTTGSGGIGIDVARAHKQGTGKDDGFQHRVLHYSERPLHPSTGFLIQKGKGHVLQGHQTELYSCGKTVCGPATVAYSFTLQDDTAAIEVIVPCSCFGQMSIADGERVTVTVSIRILEKDGLQSPAVVGIAHDIRVSRP